MDGGVEGGESGGESVFAPARLGAAATSASSKRVRAVPTRGRGPTPARGATYAEWGWLCERRRALRAKRFSICSLPWARVNPAQEVRLATRHSVARAASRVVGRGWGDAGAAVCAKP